MKSVKYYKFKMVLGYLYVTFIIFMSLVPDSFMPKFDPTKHDVLFHFTAYFIMMLWFARIYPCKNYPYLATIFISLGIGLEFIQGIMGTREFQTIDMLFNATGVLFAWSFSKFCLTPVITKKAGGI